MSKEINFESLGISEDQIQKLSKHFEKAQNFVFPQDKGIGEALVWLESNMAKYLPSWAQTTLKGVVINNFPDLKVEYLEQGYDSCQSHRKLSKVISESILIGGVMHEYELLGIHLDVNESKSLVGSTLNLDKDFGGRLAKIAKEYGANQDFIFPGVTPSDENTPSLKELAFYALSGNPQTSVRILTGVGGLRFDKDWNYATDFATFIKLKITEDKRYYPGIAIFYALMNIPLDNIPAVKKLKDQNSNIYNAIKNLSLTLGNIKETKFQGVSLLCSSYIPNWNELKLGLHSESVPKLELAESFHSPAYEFSVLKKVFENLFAGKVLDGLHTKQLESLETKLKQLWSFNSTIHLPWTSELAGLSNNLIGSITNNNGDYAIRYGVGYKGKALEIREYHFGINRRFSVDVAGKVFYSAFYYPKSESFDGKKEAFSLESDSALLTKIMCSGFMSAALSFLSVNN